MTYLLDTNVVSEPMRRAPEPRVLAWLAARRSDELFVSVATVGEVRYGIERIPQGPRRRALETWFDEVFAGRPGRVLPVDFPTADLWGRLRRRAELERRPAPLVDALIAATAERHGLTLVTRNVRDFEVWGGPVFDPWSSGTL